MEPRARISRSRRSRRPTDWIPCSLSSWSTRLWQLAFEMGLRDETHELFRLRTRSHPHRLPQLETRSVLGMVYDAFVPSVSWLEIPGHCSGLRRNVPFSIDVDMFKVGRLAAVPLMASFPTSVRAVFAPLERFRQWLQPNAPASALRSVRLEMRQSGWQWPFLPPRGLQLVSMDLLGSDMPVETSVRFGSACDLQLLF